MRARTYRKKQNETFEEVCGCPFSTCQQDGVADGSVVDRWLTVTMTDDQVTHDSFGIADGCIWMFTDDI